jgi:hypothetical protein
MSRVEVGGRGVKTRSNLTPAEVQKMHEDAVARMLAERVLNDAIAAADRARFQNNYKEEV